MNEFKIIAGRDGRSSKIEINGQPVQATGVRLEIGFGQITTLSVDLLITEETVIAGEGFVEINAQAINDNIGLKVYRSLKERYEAADVHSRMTHISGYDEFLRNRPFDVEKLQEAVESVQRLAVTGIDTKDAVESIRRHMPAGPGPGDVVTGTSKGGK